MQLRKLFDDDDAVSPVIGVILMVAITVILAAVIATFVLGLGEQVSNTAPQASFSFEFNEGATDADDDNYGKSGTAGTVNITHAGGATLKADQLFITGSSDYDKVSWADGKYNADSDISSGDTATIGVDYEDDIKVTWQNEQGTNSATLSSYQVPSKN